MKKILVLFDIDETLINKHKAVGERFCYTMNKVFGSDPNNPPILFSGKTDMQIFLELGESMGISRKTIIKNLPQICAVATEYSKNTIPKVRITSKKGAKRLLIGLEKRGYILGLVTGNFRGIARLKLVRVAMDRFFKFGGFGDISDKRADLVISAVKQAAQKFEIDKKRIFYFGDSLLDVRAGKEAKVITIAVATGHYTMADLQNEQPEYLLRDLSNFNKILGIITK